MKTRYRVALPITLSLVALLTFVTLHGLVGTPDAATKPSEAPAPALPPPSNGAISPKDQANSLHLVIAADRDLYCQLYAARQTADASVGRKPGESWPAPCELFRRAAESVQSRGAEFSYALRSLTPIDPRNGPQTELEQRGLAFVNSHPTENYYDQEMLGGRRYVTAVYPDLPAASACVECHNRRLPSDSPRLKSNDVKGGIVVRVPLEF